MVAEVTFTHKSYILAFIFSEALSLMKKEFNPLTHTQSSINPIAVVTEILICFQCRRHNTEPKRPMLVCYQTQN